VLAYKAWLDTRWRLVIALVITLVSACGILISFPQVQALLPTVGAMNVPDGPLTEAIEKAVRIQSTYRGFVWSQWFDQNFGTLTALFAALLGSGSPLASSGRGVLFSLALPAPRRRWVGARAAVGLAELFALVLVGALALPAFSPLLGQQFAWGDALVFGFCVFTGGCVFFGFAMLLSSVFNDMWRPFLLTCLGVLLLGIAELALPDGHGLFATMSGQVFFDSGSLPWLGLLVSAVLTAAFVYLAAARIARRDF
jgi:ABC-type transport system involved in multi-copper enzyme maturation permease subunit